MSQMDLSFQIGLTAHPESQLQYYFATLSQSHSIGKISVIKIFENLVELRCL